MVKNGKYYACFSCEVEQQALPQSAGQVGVDPGLLHLAITSDGQTFEAPKRLGRMKGASKQLQRSVSRKKRNLNRRVKAVHILSRLHEKVANQRKDYVSRQLVDGHGLIALENLMFEGWPKIITLRKALLMLAGVSSFNSLSTRLRVPVE